MKVKKIPEQIKLVLEDGREIIYKRINDGTWKEITEKVEKDGHWGRFLVFEEIKLTKL